MRLTTTLALGLLLAACSGAPTGTPGTTGSPTAPASSPTGGTSPPTTTPSGQPSASVSPGGGVTGPVFTGSLDQAFPPVLGGEQVQVFGPVPVTEMENMDVTSLGLIGQLGLDPSTVEVAFATDSGDSVIIFAVRFTGVDATTLDSSYIAAQEAAPGTSNFRVVTIAGRNVHAFDSIIGTTYTWVNGDILFTVFGSETGAAQAIASMPLPTVALTAGGEVLADALIDLSIVGGPHAGGYHGETSSGGCSRNALVDNSFGLQFTDDANADGFTSLQLVVRDAAAAEAGETEDFTADVNIGPMFGGTPYRLDPTGGDGTGTVSIDAISTDSAIVTISGQTADGTGIEATVICNVVFNFGGG
jgi:hypothetical protein